MTVTRATVRVLGKVAKRGVEALKRSGCPCGCGKKSAVPAHVKEIVSE